MHGHGGRLTKRNVKIMATKNMHKNVEAIIENIKNFDKQTNLNWDPIIKTKTYISSNHKSIEISIEYDEL